MMENNLEHLEEQERKEYKALQKKVTKLRNQIYSTENRINELRYEADKRVKAELAAKRRKAKSLKAATLLECIENPLVTGPFDEHEWITKSGVAVKPKVAFEDTPDELSQWPDTFEQARHLCKMGCPFSPGWRGEKDTIEVNYVKAQKSGCLRPEEVFLKKAEDDASKVETKSP